MKILLAMVAMIFSFAVCADMIDPTQFSWVVMAHTRDAPMRTHYIGPVLMLSGNKYEPEKAIFAVWWKIEFDLPQPLDGSRYGTDILQLQLDCIDKTFTVLRDIKYGADGKVILDVNRPSKPEPLDLKFRGDLGALPPEKSVAFESIEWTCHPNSE